MQRFEADVEQVCRAGFVIAGFDQCLEDQLSLGFIERNADREGDGIFRRDRATIEQLRRQVLFFDLPSIAEPSEFIPSLVRPSVSRAGRADERAALSASPGITHGRAG